MEDVKKTASAINSLITINNDRYEGYKTAAEETKDADLKSLFNQYSQQSKGFADELRTFVPAEEKNDNPDKTTASGKIFRAWMDLKSAVTGNDRKAILSSCEFGEDNALKTYNDVLENPEDLDNKTMDVIKKHHVELKKGHDNVKSMRDSAK